MFQVTTRFILFLVGATINLTATRVGSIGPVLFSVARTSILVLLVWSLLIWFIDRRRLPRDNRNKWLLAFAVALLVSVVVSVSAGNSAKDMFFSSQQIFASIVFSLLLIYGISDRQRLDAFLVGYLVCVVITSVSVVLSGVGLQDLSTQAGLGGRTGGLAGDANRYAMEAAVGVMVAVLYFYTRPTILWRIFLGIVIFLALAGIMKSLSRSALVAGVFMFGLWMVRFRRFDTLRYALPVGVLLGVSLLFVSADWTKRMNTMTSTENIQGDSSIMSRVQMGEFSLRAFASNPVLGIGFKRIGPWSIEHGRYLRHADPEARGRTNLVHSRSSIHNLYLAVMAEMGLLGMIPFYTFLVLTWSQYTLAWRFARGKRSDPEMRALHLYGVFLQLAYSGVLVSGLFLPVLHWKSLWALMGLSIVILGLVARRAEELETKVAAPEAPTSGGDQLLAASGFGGPGRLDGWPSPS